MTCPSRERSQLRKTVAALRLGALFKRPILLVRESSQDPSLRVPNSPIGSPSFLAFVISVGRHRKHIAYLPVASQSTGCLLSRKSVTSISLKSRLMKLGPKSG